MSNSNSSIYKHGYKWNEGQDFYIHRHMEHIGLMNNGTEGINLVKEFNEEKSFASKSVKRNYQRLFLNTVVDSNTKQKLMACLNGSFNLGSDEILSAISQQMKEDLQNNLKVDKISKILAIEKSLSWNEDTLEELNKMLQENTGDFQALNNIIEAIAKASRQLNGEHSKEMAAGLILITQKSQLEGKEGIKNRKEYGEALNAWLTSFTQKVESSRTTINQKQVMGVIPFLQSLGRNLESGKSGADQKKTFTANGLKTLVENNIFSTGFGEAVAAEINRANSVGLSKLFKDVELSGTDTVNIEFTHPSGAFREEINNTKAYGKADLRFNNYTISLESIGIQDEGEIKVSVGISNKFYKNGTVYNGPLGDPVSGSFHSGGGLKLGRAIDQTFANNKKRYLAYNTFAWEGVSNGQLTSALIALQDVLLTRNIVSLFGARGSTDFSHFMLLNGQFVSIWDMILYACENDIGKSQSLLNDNSQQGLAIHINKDERDSFSKYLNQERVNRLKNTNAAIRKAGMQAVVRPQHLSKMLSKS